MREVSWDKNGCKFVQFRNEAEMSFKVRDPIPLFSAESIVGKCCRNLKKEKFPIHLFCIVTCKM